MKPEIMFQTAETVEFINNLKVEIRENIKDGNLSDALTDYKRLWTLADFGVYTIQNQEDKRAFLKLILTASDDIRDELRGLETKHFYDYEEFVVKMYNEDCEIRKLEKKEDRDSLKRLQLMYSLFRG